MKKSTLKKKRDMSIIFRFFSEIMMSDPFQHIFFALKIIVG